MAIDHTSRGIHYAGNPELDPEQSKTWEGGIDFSYAPFNSSLTWFYTDFKDKIVSVTTTNGDSSWDNLGDATVSGFEGEFSCDIGALLAWKFQLKPYLSFTYLLISLLTVLLLKIYFSKSRQSPEAILGGVMLMLSGYFLLATLICPKTFFKR